MATPDQILRGYNIDRLVNQGNIVDSVDNAHLRVFIPRYPGLKQGRAKIPGNHQGGRLRALRALQDLQNTGSQLLAVAPPILAPLPAAPPAGPTPSFLLPLHIPAPPPLPPPPATTPAVLGLGVIPGPHRPALGLDTMENVADDFINVNFGTANAKVRLDFKFGTAPKRLAPAETSTTPKIRQRFGRLVRSGARKTADTLSHGTKETFHPFSIYRMSGASALAVLSGLYDQRELFREAVFRADTDLEKIDSITRRPFFNHEALRHVVEEAAIRGVLAQIPPGNHPAGSALKGAHRLIGLWLEYANNNRGPFRTTAQDLFFELNNIGPGAVPPFADINFTRYQAILTGLCLSGVIRFGKDAKRKDTKSKKHLSIAISVLGAAVSGIPVPAVGVIGGVLGALADPIADKVFNSENITPEMLALQATIEDEVVANPGLIIVTEYVYQLSKTVIHCGCSS